MIEVKITETLERAVKVKGGVSIDEALAMIQNQYNNESIVLDSSDFISTSFSAYAITNYIFLYKDKNNNDKDCVKYIENEPIRFECEHYFGGMHLKGACFSTCINNEKPNYDDVVTILTREEFEHFIQFNTDISKLGSSITKGEDKYNDGLGMVESIKPIFEKLNSKENAMLFDKIVEEETEYLMKEYDFTEDDVKEIFDESGVDFKDRGVISYIFNSIDECAEAESLEYVTEVIELDYEQFRIDLQEDEGYVELSDGRVVVLNN